MIRIADDELEIFNRAIAEIEQSFQARTDAAALGVEAIECIGLDCVGVAKVIADWDVAQSGPNGAWLKTLSKAVNIAFGSRVCALLPDLHRYAQWLIKNGFTSSGHAMDTSGIDQKIYAEFLGDEVYCCWLITQSKAYLFQFRPEELFDDIGLSMPAKFDVREIPQDFWYCNRARADFNGLFEYGDNRDPGYCGSLDASALTPLIKDGFWTTAPFSAFFDRIFCIVQNAISSGVI